jgi:hypothetical protein
MHAQIYLNILLLAMAAIVLFILGRLNHLKAKLEKHIKKSSSKMEMESKSKWYIYVLLIFAFLAVIFAFCAPYLYTDISGLSDTKDTGAMGDTVGGLMNPYIALAGVILTGLAFYMQYEANKQQRALFLIEQDDNKKGLQEQIDRQQEELKHQQFESQFYEMVRLHRENVSEMKIEGYDFIENEMYMNRPLERFATNTEGRKVFITMKTELEAILSAYTLDHELDSESFKACYHLFFSGLDKFSREYSAMAEFAKLLRKSRKAHQSPSEHEICQNALRKKYVEGVELKFNYKPFSGHASRLGHYFRHLYLAVKSVVNSEVVKTKEEKMRYLKILRAQLSNHEQIMLFYNWLSTFGGGWENNEHHFFTEYNMIHNLWHDELHPDPFIKSKVDFLREKAKSLGNDDIYEIG